MPSLQSFPKRTIHLDFHTSPVIPDIGADFDADQFAQTFVDAHVDSVTLFAKCHHGLLYYGTERPERHPGLRRDLDLLGEQIEALRRCGIKTPLYVSVQVDEYAAHAHPEWCAVDEQGRKAGMPGTCRPDIFFATWNVLDMSSPYQDYLAEQVDEVLRMFAPVDGLFLDMCWDQPSCSKWAIDGMRKARLDPISAADRARYARRVALGYMARFKKMVDDAQKGHAPVGVWFNSRPKMNLHMEKKFLRHIEIECLPTGGWGYAYFPYVARFVRPLGLPILSHTARFHLTWGDFGGIKPKAALMYECASTLSQGMTVGVGDQLHPRGSLDRAAYELIGSVYAHIEACEPFVEGAKVENEVAVIIDPEAGDSPGPVGLGLTRALQELRQQFDLLPPSAPLDGFQLVIVPEVIPIDAALKKKLQGYLRKGGRLIVIGDAALDGSGRPVMKELGIEAHGHSPYTTTYLRPGRSMSGDMVMMDHVLYEPGHRITAGQGGKALCRIVEPYFERAYDHFCSHGQTPPGRLSRYAGIVKRDRVITLSFPLFTAYGKHASVPLRKMLGHCIDRLLPEPWIRDSGPAHMETTVVRKGSRTIVHILSFIPVRRAEGLDLIEDSVPLVNMPLSVRLSREPRRVFLAPQDEPLPFIYRNGRVEVEISTTAGHVMVVFD